MFCLLSIAGPYLSPPDKFSAEADRLEEFVLLALEGLACAEFELEPEGFNIFLELLAVGLSRVDTAAFFARNASIDIGS